MIKKMEIFLKVISFLNIIVVFVALIVSGVVLKQTPTSTTIIVIVFVVIFSILIWMRGKSIGTHISEKQEVSKKKIIMLLGFIIIMDVLQKIFTIIYILALFKNVSILFSYIILMSEYLLIDKTKKIISAI